MSTTGIVSSGGVTVLISVIFCVVHGEQGDETGREVRVVLVHVEPSASVSRERSLCCCVDCSLILIGLVVAVIGRHVRVGRVGQWSEGGEGSKSRQRDVVMAMSKHPK